MGALRVGTGKVKHRPAIIDGNVTRDPACGANWSNGRFRPARPVAGDPDCQRCEKIVNQ